MAKTIAQLEEELKQAGIQIAGQNTELGTLRTNITTLTADNTKLIGERDGLKTQVATLQGRVAEMEGILTRLREQGGNVTEVPPQDPAELAIREKMRAGLDRDQAILVIANQRAEDAAREKAGA